MALSGRPNWARSRSRSHGIVEAIADGMYHPWMKEKMTRLEARKEDLTVLLADAPADTPDVLPSGATIYAQKVAVLAEALNQPHERLRRPKRCGC